jgi:hypothetical protein
MKKLKRLIVLVLPGIAALCFLACTLEPPQAVPGATGDSSEGGGKTGRVLISIAAPGEAAGSATAAAASRTLMPEYDGLQYKLEFTRQGETEPDTALTKTITTATAEQDLDPGVVYTLTVTAYKGGTTNAVARGSVPVTVLTGEATEVTVSLALALGQAGTGFLNYEVTLPVEMTLTGGFLALYPLSGPATPVHINLSAGLIDTKGISSRYYRAQLVVYGKIDGAGKHTAKNGVVHINDSFTTKALYELGADDFSDFSTIVYAVGNQAELNSALDSIKAAPETGFIILVIGNFSSGPVSLADSGYAGKTITLCGVDGPREISLSSQGSLFTVGSASSEPVFILQDIILKGITSNNAALVKLDKGELIMEDGSVVTGNTNLSEVSGWGPTSSADGGGVYVAGGTFTMRDSASVSGNTASSRAISTSGSNTRANSYSCGGGVYVTGGGTFAMQDTASVSGNTARSYANGHGPDAFAYGGGVYVASGGTLTIQDNASISGNTASTSIVNTYSSAMSNSASYGGGACIADGGTLGKSGGIIYGSNTAKTAGAAVYYNDLKYRNTTVGPEQNLSTGSNANWSD